MNKKTRDSNIELLRIILMMMIVMHHMIVHGYGIKNLVIGPVSLTQNDLLMFFINSFLIMAVNAYIFISAYFGMKFSIRNLISFIVQASFYSLVLYCIFSIYGYEQWSLPNLFRSVIPILSGKWWFLSGYVLLFILSPIINAGIDNLSKKQHCFLMISIIIFSASFYITNFSPDSLRINISTIGLFLTIYICGRYFRRFDVLIKKPLLGYIIFSIIVFITFFIYYKYVSHEAAWNMFGYTNPVIIGAAICIFYTFRRINIKSAFINSVSTLTLGVYLIHDYDPTRRFLINYVQSTIEGINNTFFLVLIILFFTIGIFIICCCIEKIRQIIFNPLVDYIANSHFVKRLNFW